MKLSRALRMSGWTLFCFLVCLALHVTLPNSALAQCPKSQGFNTVYSGCTTGKQGTFAFVDATQFATGTDICGPIGAILQLYGSGTGDLNQTGVVIDARGFGPATTCASNPWSVSSPVPSSVVLLPVGTITLSQTVALPSFTRLIGAGSGLTTLAVTPGPGSFPGTGDMIDMGNSTICGTSCVGVAVEHLALNGGGNNLNGIVNQYSQELSYVNDVSMSNLGTGTGLWLNVHSNNSGPYANMNYSGSGICAQIYDNSGSVSINRTRGIHGLTCTMTGSNPAVLLDAPNNTLEDVYISGSTSQDGIRIGSQGAAYNNVIINVHGYGLANVVHLDPASGSTNVADLTIMGSTCSGTGGCSGNNIKDELLGGAVLTNATVGMYILGEPVTNGGLPTAIIGYSRFTTSASSTSAAWFVGSTGPVNPCDTGSLYSCTSASSCSTTTLYDCEGGKWLGIE